MVKHNRFPFSLGLGLFDERATQTKLEGYLGSQQQGKALDKQVVEVSRPIETLEGEEEKESYNGVSPAEDDEEDRDEEEYEDDSETLTEMEEELEETQSKLMKTQDHLKQWDEKIHALQYQLQSKEKLLKAAMQEKNILIREVERLNAELDEKEEVPEGTRRPELEQRLRKAVEYLKKDLTTTQEKYRASQIEVRNHKSKIDHIEEKNHRLSKTLDEMQSKTLSSQDQLLGSQDQLAEAREEATKLTEEMVDLREQLRNALKIAEEKESTIEREISKRVKEKIHLEVREEVTKAVEERTERRTRADMQLAHDKEINILRAEFKKVFKENSALKRSLEISKSGVTKTEKLEHQIPILKDEVERLEVELETTKEDHERDIEDLETRYRTEIQSVKEQAAKEKWEHATEIRRQISKERDREVQDFTKRIEALSQQTDRLLQRAEREKEEYADQVRQRITQEKQREIQVMMDKLSEITKESEDLLKEAASDKEAYADQVRQQLTEEKNREMNKLKYRIEVLTGEKDVLEQRIKAFEQEIAGIWQDQEKNVDKIASMNSALKSSEDEILKLEKANQNLATLVERYNTEHKDATAAFSESKAHFRKSLLESEEKIFSLNDQNEELKKNIRELQNDKSRMQEELRLAAEALADTRCGREKPGSISQEMDVASETSSVNTLLSALESEKARLMGRRTGLKSLKHKHDSIRISDPLVYFDGHGIPEELRLEEEGQDGDKDTTFDHFRRVSNEKDGLQGEHVSKQEDIHQKDCEISKVQQALTESEAENNRLARIVGELKVSLDECKKELVRVTGEQETNDQATHNVATVNAEIHRMRRQLQTAKEDAEMHANRQISSSLEFYKQEMDTLRTNLMEANARLTNCRCSNEFNTFTFSQEQTSMREQDYGNDTKEEETVASNETDRLNNEIVKLKSMIDQHKLEFADQQSSREESHGEISNHPSFDDNATLTELENQINWLQREVENRDAKLLEFESMDKDQRSNIEVLTSKIQELESLLSSRNETPPEQEDLRAENNILTEKVNELEMLLKEFNHRLSETSEELVVSRQEVCLGGESISHLKLRLEKLTQVLEDKERKINDDAKTFEQSKIRFDEHVEKAHQEILNLQSQIEELTFLLNQTQAELQASRDQEMQARAYLNEEFVQASNASKALQIEKQQLQEALLALEAAKTNTQQELLETKLLFKDALFKSEKTIDGLNEKIEELTGELSSAHKKYKEALEKISETDEEMQNALKRSTDTHEERLQQLRESIDSLVSEKERLMGEQTALQTSFDKSTREFELEKTRFEKELSTLQNEVAASNEENAEVTKELQHSRQLFREALIAWRVETRDLTQQLDMLKGRDQWLSTGSNSRDSFSVQSSIQNIGNGGVEKSKMKELRTLEHPDEHESNTENGREIGGDVRTESPGRAQAHRFFNDLLKANNEDDEIMAGVYLQENLVQSSNDERRIRDSRKDDENVDMDDSVNTGGSRSLLSNDSLSTTQRKKGVRWSDEPQEMSSYKVQSTRPPMKRGQRKIDKVSDAIHDRVSDTTQECERRESSVSFGRKSNVSSSCARNGASVSTEEGSLRGSNFLPHGGSLEHEFPAHSSNFQQFRRSQQQHIESSESRDDTVQSRDSTFLSYTYSSTSNYSSRDFYEYSQHVDKETHHSQRNSVHSNTPQPIQRDQHLQETNHDDSTVVSGLSASSYTHPNRISSRQPQTSPRSWSPRYMELFSKQKSDGEPTIGKPPKSQVILSKPVPYDEQKEEVEDEGPFDEKQRKLLEQQQQRSMLQQQRDDESVSISLADTSTLVNSEIGSLTMNTDRSLADSAIVSQNSE